MDPDEIMGEGRIAWLPERGVVRVAGAEARRLLQDVVTTDMDRVAETGAGYGALLTPQGKVLFDFIVLADGEAYLFDLPKAMAADLARRLTFYRLRAKVEIADASEAYAVAAIWGTDERPELRGAVARDPRLEALGWRAILPKEAVGSAGLSVAEPSDYAAHRIGLGVAEGGVDFAYGEVFPHDADIDQLNGIAFAKGCYVGQEVVSRMEHRGTARRRVVKVVSETALPEPGAAITAGGKPVGTLGSSAGASGLALVRLDRAKEAIDAGVPLLAGEARLILALPDWARFGWPTGRSED